VSAGVSAPASCAAATAGVSASNETATMAEPRFIDFPHPFSDIYLV
jgi:hypothetical protein